MPYKIKQYSYEQADRLRVNIKPSSKANYKIDVFNKDGEYITSIGDKSYKDFPSYAELNGIEYANKRRSLYHARHKNDNGIRGFYAKNILW